jgi:hypothetical protein
MDGRRSPRRAGPIAAWGKFSWSRLWRSISRFFGAYLRGSQWRRSYRGKPGRQFNSPRHKPLGAQISRRPETSQRLNRYRRAKLAGFQPDLDRLRADEVIGRHVRDEEPAVAVEFAVQNCPQQVSASLRPLVLVSCNTPRPACAPISNFGEANPFPCPSVGGRSSSGGAPFVAGERVQFLHCASTAAGTVSILTLARLRLSRGDLRSARRHHVATFG